MIRRIDNVYDAIDADDRGSREFHCRVVVGALSGATVGESGIPRGWIGSLADWPRNPLFLRKLADRLACASAGEPAAPVRYFWPGVLPRNAVFLVLVLARRLRRLFPFYR